MTGAGNNKETAALHGATERGGTGNAKDGGQADVTPRCRVTLCRVADGRKGRRLGGEGRILCRQQQLHNKKTCEKGRNGPHPGTARLPGNPDASRGAACATRATPPPVPLPGGACQREQRVGAAPRAEAGSLTAPPRAGAGQTAGARGRRRPPQTGAAAAPPRRGAARVPSRGRPRQRRRCRR